MRRALALLPFAACSGGGDDATPPVQPPPTMVAPTDAAIPDAGIKVIQSFNPASGLHLDDDDGTPTRAGSTGPRTKRTLEILLRSTPPGATAVVSGEVIGKTPTLWEGDFTGGSREFTFILPGYVLARYSFVPMTNGIVHARLVPVVSGDQRDQTMELPDPAVILPPAQPPTPRRPPPPPDAPPASDAAPAPTSVDAAPGSPSGRPVVGPTP